MAPHRNWNEALSSALHLFGHRNWIVIADSAFPLLASPGIETMVVDAEHVDVVARVLLEVEHTHHARPIVMVDTELSHIDEADAPGAEAFRKRLAGLIDSRPVERIPHERILQTIDETAKTLNILILKTRMIIPYTSVFIKIDAGYWSDEAEARMRTRMRG